VNRLTPQVKSTSCTTSAPGSGLAAIAAPLYVAAHTRSPLIVSASTWRVFNRAAVAQAYAEPG
jgi:hypothetical protein